MPGASVPCAGADGRSGGSGRCRCYFHLPCARVVAACDGSVLFAGRSTKVACRKHHKMIHADGDAGQHHFAGFW
jgi:hypothetical protein